MTTQKKELPKDNFPDYYIPGQKPEPEVPVSAGEGSVNFMQTVPDSHFWTSIKMLLNFLSYYQNKDVNANYLIIGLQNCLKNGYDISKPAAQPQPPIDAVSDAIEFHLWTQREECEYSLNDDDDWQHSYKLTDNITTKKLYQIFLKETNQLKQGR